jgi:hypothetical protein
MIDVGRGPLGDKTEGRESTHVGTIRIGIAIPVAVSK